MIDLLFSDPLRFLRELALLIPAFLVAVTVHEIAHGLVADRLGDPTARRHGRLTLNPLAHLDPLGAIAFFLTRFGWAKPMPVNAYNLRHPRRDMVWIAVAGPLSNLIVALLALLGWVFVGSAAPFLMQVTPIDDLLQAVFKLNVLLAIFNLIPLPPLDGGHFLPFLLPPRWSGLVRPLEQYGPLLLLLLVMSGATRYIVDPLYRGVVRAYLAALQAVL
jgi:Zn-dependent protease